MQLRVFRLTAPTILRASLRTCQFSTVASDGIQSLIPHHPWLQRPLPGLGLDKDKLEACAPPQRSSEELQRLIEVAQVPPARSREQSPKRRPDEMGRWLCNKCGEMLFEDAFCFRMGKLHPPSHCRSCENKGVLRYLRTLRGSLGQLRGSAMERARKKGLEFDLSYPELTKMLEFQGGKCAYSGVHMEVEKPLSHWRMSLERIDNCLGYTRSNCVLIAAEFNSMDASRARNVDPESVLGTAQWSLHKVEEVRRLREEPVDLNKLAIDIQHAQEPKTRQTRSSQPDIVVANHERKCPNCWQALPKSAFYERASGLSCYCKDCSREKKRLYIRSLRGHLAQCLGSARQRARLRGQDFCITKEVLLDLLARQAGRCFYSGVPLQYEQVHTDWRLSIERLDNSKGYIPDNCVLIAVEFNTSDHSRNAVGEVFGTAQWSREKVWHVWGS